MRKIRVYEYRNCDTCRKALKFLDQRGVDYDRVPIVESPPTLAELRAMVEHYGGDHRKLFNTSGQAYRELGLGEKLAAMSQAEALRLLSGNGKLVKRPFLLTPHGGRVGFKEDEWKMLL